MSIYYICVMQFKHQSKSQSEEPETCRKCKYFFTINTLVSLRLCIPFLRGWRRWSYSPPAIGPLLSSLPTAGSLLHHQQPDLMSSDLPLRTSSVPAGSRANESPVKSYTNSYLRQLGRRVSFLKAPPPCTSSYDDEQRYDVPLEGRGWWRTAKERRLIERRKIEEKMSEGGRK